MVVNFRGKDLNAAGVRVSGTKITATPDEINQALDGIAADVTAANLSELTGGAETDLHSHAASGSEPDSIRIEWFLSTLTTGSPQTLPITLADNVYDYTGAVTVDEEGGTMSVPAGLWLFTLQVSAQTSALVRPAAVNLQFTGINNTLSATVAPTAGLVHSWRAYAVMTQRVTTPQTVSFVASVSAYDADDVAVAVPNVDFFVTMYRLGAAGTDLHV